MQNVDSYQLKERKGFKNNHLHAVYKKFISNIIIHV